MQVGMYQHHLHKAYPDATASRDPPPSHTTFLHCGHGLHSTGKENMKCAHDYTALPADFKSYGTHITTHTPGIN